MPEQLITAQEALPVEASPEPVANDKSYRWFELSLVLLISVGSGLLNSLYLLGNGRGILPNSSNSR
jgi:hypothetical protein